MRFRQVCCFLLLVSFATPGHAAKIVLISQWNPALTLELEDTPEHPAGKPWRGASTEFVKITLAFGEERHLILHDQTNYIIKQLEKYGIRSTQDETNARIGGVAVLATVFFMAIPMLRNTPGLQTLMGFIGLALAWFFVIHTESFQSKHQEVSEQAEFLNKLRGLKSNETLRLEYASITYAVKTLEAIFDSSTNLASRARSFEASGSLKNRRSGWVKAFREAKGKPDDSCQGFTGSFMGPLQ